jgi:hypothetical protein
MKTTQPRKIQVQPIRHAPENVGEFLCNPIAGSAMIDAELTKPFLWHLSSQERLWRAGAKWKSEMTLISTKSGLKGREVEKMALCGNDSFCDDWEGRAFD